MPFAVNGNKVFCVAMEENDPCSLVVLDIPSGEQLHFPLAFPLADWQFTGPFGPACDAVGRWIVVHANFEGLGIDVFDGTDLAQRLHFDEHSMNCAASDGSPIFASWGNNGNVTVFRIADEGTLVPISVIPYLGPTALFVYGSRLYASTTQSREKNVIDVYDIWTGRKVKSLHYPRHDAYRHPFYFASNGRELVVGFSRADGGKMYRHLPAIQIYPL